MKTEQALREFIASRVAANLIAATISWYKDRLAPFARACPNLTRRPEPIELFLSNMTSSHETKWDVYRALKTFYKFIEGRRRFPNPMKDIKAPRRPKIVMPTLESGEILKLLQSVDNLRDRAILTLIIDTGVRAGEVCSLLKQNIRQETILAYITGLWTPTFNSILIVFGIGILVDSILTVFFAFRVLFPSTTKQEIAVT